MDWEQVQGLVTCCLSLASLSRLPPPLSPPALQQGGLGAGAGAQTPTPYLNETSSRTLQQGGLGGASVAGGGEAAQSGEAG